MLNRIRNAIYKFMYGRNGYDELGRFLFVPIILLMILSIIINVPIIKMIFTLIIWILIIYMYFRIFSKNIAKRKAENAKYLSKRNYLQTRINQRKEYRFYTCPKCKKHLRVPKGKGHIIITCKNCGYKFERKA